MPNLIPTVIPPGQWPRFCDQFSRQHRGWLATIVVQEPPPAATRRTEPSVRVLASELPLQEIALEDRDGPCDVRLIAGAGSQHCTCLVHRVLEISFEQERKGGHVGLTIRDANGQTTLVRFRAAAVPEWLDDVASGEW